jgi:hypothetical protein
MTRIWPAIGYPYYRGGTDYVFVPSSRASDGLTTATADRYEQILQLVDLVSQWRMLNESPAVQERLPDAELDNRDSAGDLIGKCKAANSRFDTTTREAMRNLAAGGSASELIDKAAKQLWELQHLLSELSSDGPSTAAGE